MAQLKDTIVNGNLSCSNLINKATNNYAFYKFPSSCTIDTSTHAIAEITLTSNGRPVFVSITGDNNPDSDTAWMNIYLYRDGIEIAHQICESHSNSWNIPFGINYLDIVAAGTHTYKVDMYAGNGAVILCENGALQSPNFLAFEI